MTKRFPRPSRKAQRLIDRVEHWTEEMSLAGSVPAEEQPAIERAYLRARRDLLEYIERLEALQPPKV